MSEQDPYRQPPPMVPPPPPRGEPQAIDDDMQFQTAEPIGPATTSTGPTCAGCKRPIVNAYYAVGGNAICATCRDAIRTQTTGSNPAVRVFKATVLGFAAAMLGAAIWFGVRYISDAEIGLIAIVVGFLVGSAVRLGSNRRGGRGYQVLAVVLTYVGIAANYVPTIAAVIFTVRDESRTVAVAGTTGDGRPTSSAVSSTPPHAAELQSRSISERSATELTTVVIDAFIIALKLPFIGGKSIIGILIIGFALWEAWKINARQIPQVTGPFPLSQGAPPPPALA